MEKDSMNPGSVHDLRLEFRAARWRQISDLEAQLAACKRFECEVDIARYREHEINGLDKKIAAMQAERPTVYIEDIIIDRLSEAEANLSLAIGLYNELAEDKQSPYLTYRRKLGEALEIVQDALHLRSSEGRV